MKGKETEAEKKIIRARVGMLFDHPFFGYLAISLEPTEKPDMNPPTMATNGRRLYYHPDFVNKLSDPELQFVIAHEIGHCFLQHLTRRQGREPFKWNLAADFAVNALLEKEIKISDYDKRWEMPAGLLLNPAWPDPSAEFVYTQIETKEVQVVGSTIDSHEEWGEAADGKDGDDGSSQGDTNSGDLSGPEGLEQEWQERVAQAANQARMKGKLPGYLNELIEGVLQPKLDWKTLLRDMVTSCVKSDFRLSPPNMKHLYRGFVLPGITGEEIKIVVVIDGSGSISVNEAQMFLSEVKGICDTYEEYTVWIMVCDTRVTERHEIHAFDPLPKIHIPHGGTDFCEPFEIVEKEALDITALVYMTDLYGRFPDHQPRNYETIWIATTDVKAPWGKVIRLPEEIGN